MRFEHEWGPHGLLCHFHLTSRESGPAATAVGRWVEVEGVRGEWLGNSRYLVNRYRVEVGAAVRLAEAAQRFYVQYLLQELAEQPDDLARREALIAEFVAAPAAGRTVLELATLWILDGGFGALDGLFVLRNPGSEGDHIAYPSSVGHDLLRRAPDLHCALVERLCPAAGIDGRQQLRAAVGRLPLDADGAPELDRMEPAGPGPGVLIRPVQSILTRGR